MTNYYKILNVAPTATKEDIKLSYRKMVQKYQPHKNSDAHFETKFKEISEAYHTLVDETNRRQYDHQRQLQHHAATGGKLLLIYIVILLAVFTFVVWYLNHLSLNTP
ncbi:MAG TPA: DnaJ domain-containing protein [Chitinophagaceae bacterium]|nr:DnaJ domain-containing protein [Chitinophagaceae bacterium]